MIEVFSTNVIQRSDAARLEALLAEALPGCSFNFDLEDCDRIFRIQSDRDVTEEVISLFRRHHFTCSVLS
ncbi:hypothetical protein [Chitinophaga solisilvae]|uniref:Uncharacterized protein n=1 Tax=Chitinophaga solisilvae TaxID=1233460 RepID=A0A9Q5D6R4_9BACT|nr:hypothetical protein [Chitinophaga solisilvae]NSL86051.1 hypothetical protein [Chitinophaga solisilvae]